jgi:CheY-like chemotaxis protein
MDVTSAPGRGTTFALYFPHLECERQARLQSSVPARANARILVVDDEPVQLRTARRVLVHLGYEVDTLRSGQEAHELFVQAACALGSIETSMAVPQSPYDLVIMDMVLNEDDDGLRVFERIRCLFPEQKGIISSGYAPTERAELAAALDLPWLTKPYTADNLGRAIRALLSGRTTSRPVAG